MTEFLVELFQNSAVSLIENEEDPFANKQKLQIWIMLMN
jgi:hypothetical protein